MTTERFADALRALTTALEELGSPAAIIGGRRVKSIVAEFAAILEDEERPAILDRLLRKAGLT